jgi:hypothetical protein
MFLLATENQRITASYRPAGAGVLELLHKVWDLAKGLLTGGIKIAYYPKTLTEIPPGTLYHFAST